MKNVEELGQLLQLERIEENFFRGNSYKTSWKRVFGGQVLAQALHAANQTVPEDRFAHSMHAYFILPGDVEFPIVYEVDRIRDGGSFTTRRVVAIQKGRPIFNMSASFQLQQNGLGHQIDMPIVKPPEELLTDQELAEAYKEKYPQLYRQMQLPRPIEFRPVEHIDITKSEAHIPFRHVWIKAKGRLPDDIRLHQEVLLYASDYNLLTTAMLPHLHEISFHEIQIASIDHGIWFHRDFRADEWLLYALDSPSASNARGFTRGSIFNQEGLLVASVVQEGLMRQRRK
ncbi:MAG: acyl-CoA thioesterase II [Bacteroidota bacterium]